MTLMTSKGIDPADLDKTVWRYMTFHKFISLITYRALWFSKLNHLDDEAEGAMPSRIDQEMAAEHQQLALNFPDDMRDQFASMNQRNIRDGRELTAVNCWFIGEDESERMWKEYTGQEPGLAIKSTIRRLSEFVFCDPRISEIGTVQYVNLDTFEMPAYDASQA